MHVTVRRKRAAEIDESVVRDVLGIYPEEKLEDRLVFSDAFISGSVDFHKLQVEAEKIIIPWQLFFLDRENLNRQLVGIEEKRRYRVSGRLIAKRPGKGRVTSRRIIDRLIRQQSFVLEQDGSSLPVNSLCGSLKHLNVEQAAVKFVRELDIDREQLWGRASKESALNYLISKAEAANVNVCRGVLTHKILPHSRVVPGDVYKNTSGFVIKDDRLPFVFLPNELNPNEVAGRQIYSLVFLLVIIGLERYDYFLDQDLKTALVKAAEPVQRIHKITTEILVPSAEVNELRGQTLTLQARDNLSSKLKISPSALVITLKLRGIISPEEAELLMPTPANIDSTGIKRSPKVSTAVQKFCGRHADASIQRALRSNTITNVQAQHLIFGASNKKAFSKYRSEIGL